MSYSRFGNADVYVYMDVNGSLACCGCVISTDPDEPTDGDWYYHSTEAMIAHLDKHRAAGHDVPDYINEALRADDKDNFPPQCRDGHAWGEPFAAFPNHDVWMRRLMRKKCARCDWVTSAGLRKVDGFE